MNGFDIAERVHEAIWNFSTVHGIRPNRIIVGYDIACALAKWMQRNISNVMPMTFEGVQVDINKINPMALSVGYMEDTVI